MSRILYVTTFNKRLYTTTGRNILRGFQESGTEGDFFIAYEDNIGEQIPDSDRFIVRKMDGYPFLNDWLKKNEDIIPASRGGRCEEVLESGKIDFGLALKFESKFHKRFADWFRKIAALKMAMDYKDSYDALVFLDCDVVFRKRITEHDMLGIFAGIPRGVAVFYHMGEWRKSHGRGVESGIIGFHMKNEGDVFLEKVFDKFTSGEFRNYKRWDDAWVFTMVIEENPNINTRDLVNVRRSGGHVVHLGHLGEFLEHKKGCHGSGPNYGNRHRGGDS